MPACNGKPGLKMEVGCEIDRKTLPRKALVRATAEKALELKKADEVQYTPSLVCRPIYRRSSRMMH